jgi:vanillate/3-O-methylgallate O-demethylase
MTGNTLQSLIDQAGGPLAYLRSTKFHRRDNPAFNPPLIVPQVPYEFTAWEREQNGWRQNVALMDQSHHMQAAIVKGPDAKAFLSHLACNNLANATPDRAFQIICASPDGNIIGDGILLQSEDNTFSAVGPFILSWIAYHASVLDFDVEVEIDARSPTYANGFASARPECRYQIQGPKAWALIEKLNGGPVKDVPFFHVTEMMVGGVRMRALRHGMAGTPGLEIWGPWERRAHIRDTILREGEEFDIVEIGAAAYLSSAMESGWFQGALPDIYTADSARRYREWLKDDTLEAKLSLSGSYKSNRIEDYYRTPIDIGYGRFIHYDHEFIGRDALLAKSKQPSLKKMTLAWHSDDAAQLMKEMLSPDGRNIKMLHLPIVHDKLYHNYDNLTMNGESAGCAHYSAYLASERAFLTLALVHESVEIGDEVTIGWGEAGGGYGRYVAPETEVLPIRAIVSPTPYSRVAREDYRK